MGADGVGCLLSSESGFAGFGWIFGMVGGGLGADGVGCLLLSESGFAGFRWIFGMVGDGIGSVGVGCLLLSESGFAGFGWIFGMVGGGEEGEWGLPEGGEREWAIGCTGEGMGRRGAGAGTRPAPDGEGLNGDGASRGRRFRGSGLPVFWLSPCPLRGGSGIRAAILRGGSLCRDRVRCSG